MVSYCLKRRQKKENKNPKVEKTKNERIMLLSKYALCDSKKLRFIKEQEASGLLSMISKFLLIGLLLI